MKTIKIIDLLNKIANGEEVPKKIKFNGVTYEYRGYSYCNTNVNVTDIECYLFSKWNFLILNDEVEIIEDGNKIEKIERLEYSTHFDNEEFILYQNILAVNSNLNDVIDYLESKEKGE